MIKKHLVLLIIGAISVPAFADQCESALKPTIETTNKDYRVAQSFMYVNAENDYDRLKKLDSGSRNADASYKVFSAEYSESTTKEQYQEKVREKLTKEGFNMAESDAREYYRRYFSDAQLAAWSSCIASQNASVGLLLSAKDITENSFTLRAKWMLPNGVGEDLRLQIIGGTINNKNSISDHYTGSGSQDYAVIKTKNDKEIRVIGNMASLPDSLLVSYKLAPIPKPVKEQTKCFYKPEGAFYDFDNDGCHDQWAIDSRTISISSGSGGSFRISPSATYDAGIGIWLAGDFNGDGKTDLVQVVTSEGKAYTFCDIHSSTDHKLREFNFKKKANNLDNYCASCGTWTVEDFNNDGISDLKHLAPSGVHKWISEKGAPPDNENGSELCGHFVIR